MSLFSSSSLRALTLSTQSEPSTILVSLQAFIMGSRKRAAMFLSTPILPGFICFATAAATSSVSVSVTVFRPVSPSAKSLLSNSTVLPSSFIRNAQNLSNGITSIPVR